jgi:NitT/TauT family transport system substrate-binding protein
MKPGQRRTRESTIRVVAGVLAFVIGSGLLSACSGAGDSDTVVVNMGYQSKTINTVNAGTLLRDRGTFEAKLAALGAQTGKKYQVVWQDFASGAPLTAQMIASQVDIGSMGDYPLLVNGAKTQDFDDAQTELVAVTGYNLRGSLNQVVVPTGSTAQTLEDMRGRSVSTSVGSAGDGMLSSALMRQGMSTADVNVVNQEPPVGASAIEGKQVDALAQFVPWPQVMVFRNQARLLYDGGDNEVPTFHGVVARKTFASAHPEVMQAFMASMKETTDYIVANPMPAALRVSEITGIEPEVVYLYNGPGGLVSFDMTIKDQLVEALAQIKPFLVERGSVTAEFDVSDFIADDYVRAALGDSYDTAKASVTNPSALSGVDEICQRAAGDPLQASELWPAGQDTTRVAATPTCLLEAISVVGEFRAAYVPDTATGTRLFADRAVWVENPNAEPTNRFVPFATQDSATAYVTAHSGSSLIEFRAALSNSNSGS